MSYTPDMISGIDYGKLRWMLQSHYAYRDYATLATIIAPQTYLVGTNSRTANAANWPALDPIVGRPIWARRIIFLATEDCWVKLGPNEVELFIPQDDYMPFFPDSCVSITYRRDTTNGTLRMWIEGGP